MRKKLLSVLIIGFIIFSGVSRIISASADANSDSYIITPGEYDGVSVSVNAGDIVRVSVTSDIQVTVWLCTFDEYNSGAYLLGSYEEKQSDTTDYQYEFTSTTTYDMAIVIHDSFLSSYDAHIKITYSSYPPFEDFIMQNLVVILIVAVVIIILCCVLIFRKKTPAPPPQTIIYQQTPYPVGIPPQPQPYAYPSQSGKQFCSNCGKEIPPGMKFCNNCGTPH